MDLYGIRISMHDHLQRNEDLIPPGLFNKAFPADATPPWSAPSTSPPPLKG